jgi:hypothetical protein
VPSEEPARSVAEQLAAEQFVVEARMHRRRDSDKIEYLRLAGYIGKIEWFGGIITCSP